MSDQTTPRPWEVFQLDPDNWGVCAANEPPHGIFGEEVDAAFTCRAANSYDDVRALVEAAERFMRCCEQGVDPISKEARARSDDYGNLQTALSSIREKMK